MRVGVTFAITVLVATLLAACGSGDGMSAGDLPASNGGGGGAVGTATLSWNGPSTNADGSALADLAGYRVYQSTTSGSYPATPAATVAAPAGGGGTATATLNNLAPGTYYYVVRAYDSSGNESTISNEASLTILSGP
jgi:hypothetical protein